jgi:predicted Zn-dependent protease
MDYQNPQIPEGINVSKEHPLKEFFALLTCICLAVVVSVMLLSKMAEQLVQYVPFKTEQLLAEKFRQQHMFDEQPSSDEQQIESYLQNFADKVAKAQQLPAEMAITIHYQQDEVINAYATLGGHIVIYRGLLKKIPHENALAMLLAHEIAHIKHRDPIIALGRGVAVTLALTSIAGVGDEVAAKLLGQVGLLTTLSFSREQERAADKTALQSLQQLYGHKQGADDLFRIFQQLEQGDKPPLLLSTHPHTEDRISGIVELMDGEKNKPLKPLPVFIAKLKETKDQ